MLGMTLIDTLEAYSTHEIAEKAGITYRQLDYLVKQGRVRPEIQDCDGSGTQRRWAPWQVGEIVQLTEEARTR